MRRMDWLETVASSLRLAAHESLKHIDVSHRKAIQTTCELTKYDKREQKEGEGKHEDTFFVLCQAGDGMKLMFLHNWGRLIV